MTIFNKFLYIQYIPLYSIYTYWIYWIYTYWIYLWSGYWIYPCIFSIHIEYTSWVDIEYILVYLIYILNILLEWILNISLYIEYTSWIYLLSGYSIYPCILNIRWNNVFARLRCRIWENCQILMDLKLTTYVNRRGGRWVKGEGGWRGKWGNFVE